MQKAKLRMEAIEQASIDSPGIKMSELNLIPRGLDGGMIGDKK